eukprot:10591526-Alexandrium_andersonii.AAC.1
MSASLVGSEMCIRDSARSAEQPSSKARNPPRQSETPQPLGPALGCAAPVSYTHLTLPTICSV